MVAMKVEKKDEKEELMAEMKAGKESQMVVSKVSKMVVEKVALMVVSKVYEQKERWKESLMVYQKDDFLAALMVVQREVLKADHQAEMLVAVSV